MEPDNRIWANPDLLKLWLWCLKKANYTDKRWLSIKSGKGLVDVEVKKGQFVYGRHSAGEELGVKAETVRKRMNKLKDLGLVTIHSTRQYSIITICNYDYYQGSNSAVAPTELPPELPTKEAPNNTPDTTTKKLKNDKNEKNEPKPGLGKVREFYDLWNQYAVNGITPARRLTKSRIKKIQLRLIEEPDIHYWQRLFGKLQSLPFYCGNNNRDWRVSLDYMIVNDTNHVGIFERKISIPKETGLDRMLREEEENKKNES
jgi:hypothetical protein